jgi:hypothetical protein
MSNYSIKENSWIAKFAAIKLQSHQAAIVIGNTIHLYNTSKKQFLLNERWLKHELCHVKQFQENGYVIFIAKYLWESIKHGYRNNKYEAEAREAENE